MEGVVTIDVLDSVLQAAGAEKYIENFKANEVETSSLKLMTEDDFLMLGVDDAVVRRNLLNHCKNLQIPTEKKINLEIDRDYTQLVLYQINHQLTLHHANLACAVIREDLTLCDVKLENASKCLLNCIESLEKQVKLFEKTVTPHKKKKILNRQLIATAASTVLFYVIYRTMIKYFK